MTFGLNRKRTACSHCGTRIYQDALLCPACGRELAIRKKSDQCPACGARVLATETLCPICGATRQLEAPPSPVGLWTIAVGVAAAIALLLATWLVKPWNEIAAGLAPNGSRVPSATPSREPSPTATISLTPTPSPSVTPSVTRSPTSSPMPSATPFIPLIHIVAQGDTLSSIAVKYDTTSEEIAKANGMGINAMLSIGQKLIIPGIPVTPTSGVTPSPTKFMTCTPTPLPTLAKALTPAYLYRSPQLLMPPNGGIIPASEPSVLLNWTSVGVLGQQEWYALSIWHSEEDTEPTRIWTKATSWRLSRPTDQRKGANHFLWKVDVVVRTSEDDTGVAISAPGETYQFSWQ